MDEYEDGGCLTKEVESGLSRLVTEYLLRAVFVGSCCNCLDSCCCFCCLYVCCNCCCCLKYSCCCK